MKRNVLILCAVLVLGYVSNAVSRTVVLHRIGVNYMGGAMGRNQALTKRFTESAISTLYIPFHVRVSVLLSLGGGTFAETRGGIYLFGFELLDIGSKRMVR
jgi:hypothetical protein